jgi:hypothetical protein
MTGKRSVWRAFAAAKDGCDTFKTFITAYVAA